MSRLDDELRQAFRREEPSPDFTARVMKAVAAAPAPKRRWWDELLARLTTPGGRWVAVGATVSLLALILATQFSRLDQAAPKGPEAAQEQSTSAPPTTPDHGNGTTVAGSQNNTAPSVERKTESSRQPNHRVEIKSRRVVARKAEAPKSEGELARDQLMLALHVASASLNEAQRIVRVSEGH
jgi:hypothetical protein